MNGWKSLRRLFARFIISDNSISPTPEDSRRYYELDLYEPHLTLGSEVFGMSEIKYFVCITRMVVQGMPSFPQDYFLRICISPML